MRGAPSVESLTPFVTRGFSDPNARVLQGVYKVWEVVQRKETKLRGSSNDTVGGYHRWLRAYTRGLDWLPKLRAAKEEEAEAPEESEEVQALKAKLEKGQPVKERFKATTVRI